MSEYTELQAKKDAVESWEIILQFIKDNEEYCVKNAVLFHTIKREALRDTKFASFISLCSYCELAKRDNGHDCDKCIGVKEGAFGVNEVDGVSNVCYDNGSYNDITFEISLPNQIHKRETDFDTLISLVTTQLNKFKRILKAHEN